MQHKIGAVQLTSSHDVTVNLEETKKLIIKAKKLGAELVVLPENFAFMGLNEHDKIKISEKLGEGPIQDFLSQMARDLKIWLVGGTFPLQSVEPHKVYAASLVFNDQGELKAAYHKIHLFDIHLQSMQECHNESTTIFPGNEVVVVETPVGRLGLSICYDVRFPELYRVLQVKGAEILVLPAAFTVPTGIAHWEVLLRARAIENQCYLIAAGQTGQHSNSRKTYGHSMIIDPWGTIKASLSDEAGVIVSEIDLKFLYELRDQFPTLKHERISKIEILR